MTSEKLEEQSKNQFRADNILSEVVGIVEWLLIALILALFFRSYIMEAYRIPTGSMAETLNGDHFRLRCAQCGYRFDHGFDTAEHGLARYAVPADGKSKPKRCRCPSCGYDLKFGIKIPVESGDRILVLKCLYQFRNPKRWDVAVFKDPQDPQTNIVKRLIAMPNESVEIIDGDIYINGVIERKPPLIQRELWIPVYNNNYQPVNPDEGFFNRQRWQQPLNNAGLSGWQVSESDPTQFILDDQSSQINLLAYNPSTSNGFKAVYSYNDSSDYEKAPYCGDIMVKFSFLRTFDSKIGAELSKYGVKYRAFVEGDKIIVAAVDNYETEVYLAKGKMVFNDETKVHHFSFANVDRLLICELDGSRLIFDLGCQKSDLEIIKSDIAPQVNILGSGTIVVSNLAIFRDIYYTVNEYDSLSSLARGAYGQPFKLSSDEYFMLGDNSPSSYDSRWWEQQGRGNNGETFRAGCVPGEYLVGKAVFVYWPGGFRPFEGWPALIPNIGGIRFIYGGSGKVLE